MPCRSRLIPGLVTRIGAAVRRRACAVAGLALLVAPAACGGPVPAPAPVEVRPPAISQDPESGLHRLELSVMTYNVWGLPWPAASGRRAALRQIARELRRMQEAGEAPDVLLLQEVFRPAARRVGMLAGYPYGVLGPRAGDEPTIEVPPTAPELRRAPRILKGEGLGKLLSSGLGIYSRYPVGEVSMTPFGRRSCAGLDCLANKGVMLARLEIPGVPQPVQVLNTHLNAGGSAGVALEQSHVAHGQQLTEIALFLERDLRPDWPFIFGGDFNTRNSEERFADQKFSIPGEVVRLYCTRAAAECDVRVSSDGDEPWMDTQDLQGFADGSVVRIRPVRLKAMFDQPRDGRLLSNHDGYLVVYELTWPIADEDRLQGRSAAPRKATEAEPASTP